MLRGMLRYQLSILDIRSTRRQATTYVFEISLIADLENNKTDIKQETGRFFRFSNIRYAAPPVRFAAPVVPETNRSSVQTGDVDQYEIHSIFLEDHMLT